ncbi:protein O-linked-mannose beta-1,4-N-acetylglucosaminyltransferase 2-like [Parasteatoda tepidariorum]|uniref:protein O-linked-mannose beta-1,4-N-acetylglucosaminyltransferase 2-like n=1 Tax=Parasteatoda tepidariorum TaxID=114398 RepID=UPI00077F8138|nr:protein O-linked-mannose beta-1,4-N-acetylglucosaminyltransferase 2-like [Parasteatoda tepidariorum]
MDAFKNLHLYLFIPLLCIVFYYCIEIYVNKEFLKHLFKSSFYRNGEIPLSELYSSVICRGTNHTDRICHFKHLCYDPQSKSFVFLHNQKSIRSGLPHDRFSPTLIDFSSVDDHNTQYFNFVELPDTFISKFNISYLKGNFLIFKRFNPENLMHVFHDDLLPSYSTLTELYTNREIEEGIVSFVFADDREPGPYRHIYENFLYKKPLYIKLLSKEYLYCFERTHIGLNKYSTWYQYGFRKPQGALPKSNLEISPIILAFQEYFQQKFSLKSHEEKKCAVLLTRKRNRRLLNEYEIKLSIFETLGLDTFVMNLEENSVFQIIEKIMKCQIMVGIHGSLLILSLFLKKFSVLLEIFPYGVPSNISTPYKTLAEIPGLNLIYRALENKLEKNSVPHPEYPPELGGILHLSDSEQSKIKNSFVSPFLCCDNPIWLYRIYQDTFVDIISFKNALIETQNEKNQSQLKREIVHYNIYPSTVRDCVCNISMDSKTLTLYWEVPWNIAFMNVSYIEYEIWVQDTSNDDVQAFITKKNYFYLKAELFEKTYYVWIRCYSNGLIGPFNSSPLICP